MPDDEVARIRHTRERLTEVENQIAVLVEEVHGVLDLVQRSNAAQDDVNQQIVRTVDTIVKRIEAIEQRLAEELP